MDLPFSLLADTLYAPVDYFHGSYDGKGASDEATPPRR
ncbi:hypothetical protein [Edwardsiella tarda]